MKTKEHLLAFLKKQRFLVIASSDDDLWVTNVFYGIDDNFRIYFISQEGAKHSQQILKNSTVAFSTVWYDEKNHKNRKGIQGKGICKPATSDTSIEQGVKLHNQNFPEFAERITTDWVKNNQYNSKVWTIDPTYIKYWDDELYGEDETEEFSFNKD